MPVALALAGAVALWLPAFRFRIDAATCGSWPALAAGAGYALAYAVAVALLAAAWLGALRRDWSLGRALALGALVHAVAMVAPPFASNDPLFYAAIGRSMARFHASAEASAALASSAVEARGAGAEAPTAPSERMSIRQPVSRAASRAFCPSLPMASDSW